MFFNNPNKKKGFYYKLVEANTDSMAVIEASSEASSNPAIDEAARPYPNPEENQSPVSSWFGFIL